MKTITAIVIERDSPFPPVTPDALIYVIQAEEPLDEEEILLTIAKLRLADLCSDESPDLIQEVSDGLRLQFIFEGDLDPIIDGRW